MSYHCSGAGLGSVAMWLPTSACGDQDSGSPPQRPPLLCRSKAIVDFATSPPYNSSPLRPSFAAVPFSWEHLPGIPKAPVELPSARYTDPLLPLPPPLRCAGERHPASDPFAAALAECAKVPPGPAIEGLLARSGSAGRKYRRVAKRAAWYISNRIGLLGRLHASCTATCAVAESTVSVPGPAFSGRLSRRSG